MHYAGTRETDALDPSTLVPTVDAIVLSGGSAFGLASADGVQRWCEEQGRGFAVPGGIVPIVPAAVIFDLGRGGDFSLRPGPELGYAAAEAASTLEESPDGGPRGCVGAGTGALIAGGAFKGGVGMASVRLPAGPGLPSGAVVAALAVVNALGRPQFPGGDIAAGGVDEAGSGAVPTMPFFPNTTLAVVATDAALDPAECRRTATAAQAGLARALSPSHTLMDGDTVFALATGSAPLDRADHTARSVGLLAVQSAAADVVQRAILDGVLRAVSTETPAGRWDPWPAG